MMDTTTETPFDALQALAKEDAKADDDRARRTAPRARAERKEQPRTSTPSRGPLERRLFQFFTMTSLVVSAVLDPVCGATIQKNAEALAKSWTELANTDPNVKKALEWLLSSGNYGQVIVVTGMTVLPILRHHNLIPGRAAEVLRIAVEEAPTDDDEEVTGPVVVDDISAESHPLGNVPR